MRIVEKGQVMNKKEQSEFGYTKYGAMINWSELNSLIGQLLTYVDATYQDKEQREAHKSLVKNTVRDWYEDCEKELPVKMKWNSNDGLYVATPRYEYWDLKKENQLPISN